MPFASKAQQRLFFARPELRKYASEWAAATDFQHLPEHVRHKKKKKKKRRKR